MTANIKQTLIPYHAKVTTPAAGSFLLLVPTSGLVNYATYNVQVSIYIDGTPAAGVDDDNIQVFFNQAFVSGVLNVPVSGAQVTYSFTVVNDNMAVANLVSLQVIALATTGAVYHACITVTPVDYLPGD